MNRKEFLITVCFFLSVTGSAAAGGKDILRFSMYGDAMGSAEQGSLDPLRSYQLLYFNLQHQIFETLVGIDFNTQKIIPVLAVKWEQLDEKSVRFHLRRGVTFHNGEPFTARSVAFTIQLLKDPRKRFAGRFLIDSIAATHIVDDYTIDIILHYRDVLLLRKFASIVFIMPPGYYRKVGDENFTRFPIGTGPFRFFYNEADESGVKEIHLVANEDYWIEDVPQLKELVYVFLPREKQWQALESGDINLLITQHAGFDKQLLGNEQFKIFTRKSLRSSFCLLNIDKEGPLQDLRIRRALQHAVRRNNIIKNPLQGYGVPMYSSAPAQALACSANLPVYKEDPALSRSIIEKSGYPQGFTLKVMASNSRPSIDIVKTLKKQFEKAGVALDVYYLSREEIFDEVIAPKLKDIKKVSSFDMWVINGWPNIFGAGAYIYFIFLHSHGMFNFGTYGDKASPIDEYYTKVINSENKKIFCAELQKLDKYIIDQSLIIPLYQPEIIYGMNKKVNFDPALNDLPLRLWECSLDTKN